MMDSLGHEVFHYGGEGSVPPCTEHITIVPAAQREKWFGHNDWRKDFYAIEWDSNKPYWLAANANAVAAIHSRVQKKDFICLIGGNCQKQIADAFQNHIVVEFGIGYHGVFSKYRVFESYAWMHHIYGELKQGDGGFYDAVIPNYFDPDDFPLTPRKEDYFLYVGRLISRKGIEMAVETTRRLGVTLKLAGQGVKSYEPGKLVSEECTIEGDHIEYVGTVNVEERGKLMGGAKALFAPTFYIGPFEGVSVEALFCGTPVITTDWGSFTENNIDGHTGYRVRTLGEATWACRNLDKLDSPQAIRQYAVDRFSLDVIRWRYEDYFRQLLGLWGKGWSEESYEPFKRMGGFR